MGRPEVEVVHVGAATRDLADDDPRGWRLGGGVSYAALTTARLGLATGAVIGLDAEASTATELDQLREAGVELLVVALAEGPVFRNVDRPMGRVQTSVATGVPMPAVALPPAWRRARAWSLVPVADELGDDWAAVPDDAAVVGVAWQGMLRTLRPGHAVTQRMPSERALLRRADLVGVSHQDVPSATTPEDLAIFLKAGARLLLTRGIEGGLMLEVGTGGRPLRRLVRYLPTPGEPEIDPTGAGDTFLATLLAATIRPDLLGPAPHRRGAALHFAAAAGSLAVEGVGLAGVPDLAAVLARAARDHARRFVAPYDAQPVVVVPSAEG